MLIDTKEVDNVLRDCMLTDKELKETADPNEPLITIEGIMSTYVLRTVKLENNKDQIRTWLAALPLTFQSVDNGGGGGWSFLQACMDIEDNQWGEHHNMEQLFVLGMGTGMVSSQVSRELWSSLPGGMPYYSIDLEA